MSDLLIKHFKTTDFEIRHMLEQVNNAVKDKDYLKALQLLNGLMSFVLLDIDNLIEDMRKEGQYNVH